MTAQRDEEIKKKEFDRLNIAQRITESLQNLPANVQLRAVLYKPIAQPAAPQMPPTSARQYQTRQQNAPKQPKYVDDVKVQQLPQKKKVRLICASFHRLGWS